jgi:hypothetical protein
VSAKAAGACDSIAAPIAAVQIDLRNTLMPALPNFVISHENEERYQKLIPRMVMHNPCQKFR